MKYFVGYDETHVATAAAAAAAATAACWERLVLFKER